MTETGLSRTPWSVRRLFGARVGMACRAVAVLVCGVGLAATTASARAGGPQVPDSGTVLQAKVSQGKEQPVRFEENRGQADPRVRYVSRARDYTVALTDDEALLLVRKPTSSSSQGRLKASDLALVRMRLAGASRTPRITATDPLPGNLYYAGAEATRPLTPIDTFARVEYAGVYPGIDLVYYGDDHRLEFDFEVAPFADPKQIALSLEGADGMTLTDAGDLSMRVGGAEVRLEKPLVYQERDGRRIEVPGAYVLAADNPHTVRLRLGSYDPSLPLVIDPTWMTVFGSTNEEWMSGFAVDSAGHPRLLGETFDPATFPFTLLESGVLPAPNCFLTKLDGATGLTTYSILFANTQRCEALALAPNDVAYFAGFVYPNGLQNNQGTTVTAVDDSSGAPVVSRFGVSNYDSTAPGEGVDALAVNSLGHVFLLGPCRIAGPGDPPLQLSGYNETPDPARPFIAEGCTPPTAGTSEKYQPLLTVVDSSGTFLYGSFLSPREEVTRYGLAADDADRAYIVGGQVEPFTVLATADAYRADCPTGGSVSEICAYLMVLDTTTTGPASLVYASYLWNTQNVEAVAVRLGPAGTVYVASEGRVFDDFPSNRPTNPSSWPYSLYPALREGVQLARFNRDANGLPSQFDFATVFDPSRGVTALNGYTVRDALADLRLFPSGAPAVASVAYTSSLAPLGIVTTFDPGGDRVGEVWTQNLGTRTPVGFGVGTGSGGRLFLAGQIERSGAQDSDVFVEQIDAVDPGANRPPTVFIFENLTTVYADSPTAGALLQINAIAADPEGDALTYSWAGPFTDNPVTTNNYLIARVPLGMQQTVTVTVDDGHGNVVSASRTFDVVGTPFVGTTATPVDSDINGLSYNYAPITITAAGIGAGGGHAYLHTRLDQNPPIPAHLQAGSPPIYFDLSTDAVLIAPIALCVDTRGMSFANPANVRLYQYQQSAWVDITSAGYPQGNQLCGRSDTLGTFAIFYPQVPSTAVQTIAGNGVREGSNDGIGGSPVDDFQNGPATSTPLPYLFGGAYDRANNQLFVSSGDSILRLNLNNNTIARVAGNGVGVIGSLDGPGGDLRDDLVDGGDAFNTYVGGPAELVMSPTGDVVFFDRNSCLIRRLDLAQGRLFAVAGDGTCGSAGDGSSAALASLAYGQMAYDTAGNLFIADSSGARVRRIDALTNVIDTVAGDGTFGVPQHGASARSSISLPLGIAFDAQGHLVVAGGMHLLRISTGAGDALVDGDADEVITVLGGCNTNCLAPFNGDTLAISHPQVYLPGMGHLTVAQDGSVIFSDSFRVRRVTPGADGIVTGASDEIISTVAGYYDWATLSQIPNFNGDTFSTQSRFGHFLVPVEDAQRRIIVVDGNNFRVRRFGLAPPPLDPNSADVAIAATDSVDPVNTGGSLRYDITVTNNGPAAATGVAMAYVIPAGALFESAASTNAIACSTPAVGSPGTVTCDFGTLAGGASSAVEITITPQTAGALSSTFTVAAAEADPNGGNNSTSVTTTVNLSPAVISVSEVIAVSDTVGVLPSAMVGVTEQIVVTDTTGLLPSALIGVNEQIVVTDGPGVLPSAMIGVTEQIVVVDAPAVTPAVPLGLTLTPANATSEVGTPRAITAFVADGSDESGRVVLNGIAGGVRVQFVNPGAANAPLSVSVTFGNPFNSGDIVVSLATNGSGALSSTAAQVVAAINANPASALLVEADTWPGNTGAGIVQPRPMAPLVKVMFTISGVTTLNSFCITGMPGVCSIAYTSQQVGVDQIAAYLDANGNGTREADEPSATAQNTWIDKVAPVLSVPAPIVAEAQTPNGAVVTFSATATDNSQAPVQVSCSPQSGSVFPFNGASPTTTSVTCTATDSGGNVATGSFTVTVQDTTAPVVITQAIAVDATEPAGARGNVPQAPHTPLLQALPSIGTATDLGDAAPARISVQWVACGNPAQVLGPVADTTLYPVGQNCIAYVFRDASGNLGQGIGTLQVNPPIGGHVLAANVPVTATDTNNQPQPVTTTFFVLDQPGLVTAVQTAPPIPLPAGFTLSAPPYDVRTTALAPPAIAVCVTPPSGITADRLFKFEQGAWVDVTTSVDRVTGAVCGRPDAAGIYALARTDSLPLGVSLLSPVGGQKVFVNVPLTVRWTATGAPASFDVLLSRSASDPFSPICANLPGTATSCSWVPFGNATSQARIRVVASNSGGTATDTSGTFSLVVALPTISVTSPTWPQVWTVGTAQTIRWQHNLGATATFRLEVSRDWGSSWQTIASAVPSATATTGNFGWTATGPAAAVAIVRVTWVEGGFDGGSVVTIEDPRITVTDSNGGDSWTIGSARTIRWSHNLGANQMVAIDLSRDGGATWSPLAASVPTTGATTGQWAWTVTGPVTSRARIRVRWLTNPAAVDQSDGDLTITPRIRVTSPNSAVSWVAGSTQMIRWTHQYGASQLFDIDFSADGGATWSSFATGVPATNATSGAYSAAMPNTTTTQALFRVSPAGVPGDGDTSDVMFTLR